VRGAWRLSLTAPWRRTLSGMPEPSSASSATPSAAELLRRRAADWAAGAEEGKALDREIARRQSAQERLDSGDELADLAGKLQRPR